MVLGEEICHELLDLVYKVSLSDVDEDYKEAINNVLLSAIELIANMELNNGEEVRKFTRKGG